MPLCLSFQVKRLRSCSELLQCSLQTFLDALSCPDHTG